MVRSIIATLFIVLTYALIILGVQKALADSVSGQAKFAEFEIIGSSS